ncbi:MAG TPA: CYTH domain-containing protein [Candidatus Blautia gallistercoris]|uniref:CYTH domain-containing protein n=1 Tax=Candidatus Blautia gallistercoris TaxID=2838490 RepID=A0A9D1WJH7_9FIRM|nr:CYTH domain-containing protein [Candidatus Blautia gallistercoris]
MEIERKFLIKALPGHLSQYKSHEIEQGYLCTAPVVRIRRQDDTYILTYKSKGLMSREEYNLPLTEEAYVHLKPKADGLLISKTRYCIPLENGLTAELDVFHGAHQGLLLAEVEFSTEAEAMAFTPPEWFAEEVTFSTAYHNSTLSQHPFRSQSDTEKDIL